MIFLQKKYLNLMKGFASIYSLSYQLTQLQFQIKMQCIKCRYCAKYQKNIDLFVALIKPEYFETVIVKLLLYCKISMPDYFEQFKREHLKEYLQMAFQAFKSNNPTFLLGLVPHQKFLRESEAHIILLLELEEKFNKENNTKIMFNLAHFENGNMIVAGFSCDLHYYITYARGKINDELLNQLCSIDLQCIPKNKAFVAMKGVVHKEWQNKGVAERGFFEKSAHMLKNGYKTEYTLMVNPFTIKILQKFGSKVWKDISMTVKDKRLYRIILERDIKVMVEGCKPKL